MSANEPFELGDDGCMPAEGEVGVDAIFECRQPLLLESRDLRSSERLLGKVGESGASPELQRAPEVRCRSVGRFVLRLLDEALEAADVHLFGRGSEEVARRARHDRVLAERLPQPRDVHLERLRRGGGRPLAPEPVDERVGRDDVPGLRRTSIARTLRCLLPPRSSSRSPASTSIAPRILNSNYSPPG